MQNYGTYRKKRKTSLSGLIKGLRLFDLILVVLSVVFAVVLLLSLAAPYVNPNAIGFIALLGLVSPVLYIVNAVILLYWVARWKIWFVIPASVLLLGVGNVTLFFRPTISRHYDKVKDRDAISIVSSNVMGFLGFDNEKAVGAFCSTLTELNALGADVICMQEYQTTRKLSQHSVDSILNKMPYKAIHQVLPSTYGGWGLAILSRYPIIKWGKIDFQENSNNAAMWADITIKRDTIRIFNCHLQTTGINKMDKDFITEDLLEDTLKRDKVTGIATKLVKNYKMRAEQADSVAMAIERTPYRNIVVCGDFNDTPVSYVYNTVRGSLRDSFVEKGEGRQVTYKGLFNMFRIDYILHSKGLETVDYRTMTSEHSDHNPIMADMKFNRQ